MSKDAKRQIDSDLLKRCRKGHHDAWKELVTRHRQSLCLSIRTQLGDEARNSQLVEDIAQEVWLALADKDSKRLRLYNSEKGCFDTFLKSIARQVIQKWRRPKCRLKKREFRLGTYEPAAPTGNEGLVRAELEEYLADLTQQEARCLREDLLGMAREVSGPPISPGNLRFLRHRLRQKWNEHFGTP